MPNLEIPADYRGISFSTWLDIFLDYAMCLARIGKAKESYEICEAAKDAIVFYHSREDMFLIHVAWCSKSVPSLASLLTDRALVCGLLSHDEETCVTIGRFFMKEYQFTTDSYRMFGAIARMCQSPISWYCSGPTQKYILRQIKAMDYALVSESHRQKYYGEKGSYSAQDENGRHIVNDDMDIALLMLYGHILYTGNSYSYALSRFIPPSSRQRRRRTNQYLRLLLPSSRTGPWKFDDQPEHRSGIHPLRT
jgi:general transcription factor 3C polypeptide 3 (transcription factor C subunit 4)